MSNDNLLVFSGTELHGSKAATPMRTITALVRYPVKGLSPERLTSAQLEANSYFPGDRLFAIENGPSGFDPAAPVHQPKIKYLMLMRHEALATLRSLSPRQAEVVDLRFFSELSLEETAATLGLSLATVKRDWSVARLYLQRALSDDAENAGGGA